MRRLRNVVEYQQAFTADGQRLCLVCMEPVATCTAPAQVRYSPHTACMQRLFILCCMRFQQRASALALVQ